MGSEFLGGMLAGLLLAGAAWAFYGFRAAPIPEWLVWRLRPPRVLKPGEPPSAAHYHHLSGAMDLIWRDVHRLAKRVEALEAKR